MKFVVIKNHLKEGLSAVERAGGESPNLPILKNVLLESHEGKIKLTATNLEIAVSYFVSGKIIEEGRVCVPLSTVTALLGTLQSERLNLESKGNNLVLVTDNYEGTLHGLPAEEFPLIPRIKNREKYMELQGETLRDALSQVVVSSQFSELRPELNGILLSSSIDSIRLAATDNFRLSEKTLSSGQFKTNHEEEYKYLVPLKTTHELIRIIKDDEKIKVYHDEHQVFFASERFELISRLIDGSFPDYHAIVPKSFDGEIKIDREDFMGGLKAAGVFSSQGNEVKIIPGKNRKTIEITAGNQNIGNTTYRLPASLEGEPREISFNWKYLADGLRVLHADEATLRVNDETKPALLQSPGDASYFYVVMPILKP